MTKIKKIVAAAVAAVSMGAIGVTAFAAQAHYFDFSIYGNSDSGYYEFSSRARKESDWYTPAKVNVYRGNLSNRIGAYISVYNYDSIDYPGERITSGAAADHLTTANNPYTLTYYIDWIDDLSNKTVYLCAETGDEHVTLEGEWIP